VFMSRIVWLLCQTQMDNNNTLRKLQLHAWLYFMNWSFSLIYYLFDDMKMLNFCSWPTFVWSTMELLCFIYVNRSIFFVKHSSSPNDNICVFRDWGRVNNEDVVLNDQSFSLNTLVAFNDFDIYSLKTLLQI
jgi:hypothetical protein